MSLIKNHMDLWAFLAVLVGIWGTAVVSVQVALDLRARWSSGEVLFDRLRGRVVARRVEHELSSALHGRPQFPISLAALDDSETLLVRDLYVQIQRGVSFRISGQAGAGKSVLARALVAQSATVDAARGHRPGPLVEIGQLRRWRRPVRQNWRGLHRWFASELDRTYPGFGRSYFRRLLVQQDVLMCLDGLDEASAGQRASLARCLNSAAKMRFPVVVLGREVDDDDFDTRLHADFGSESDYSAAPYRRLALMPLHWAVVRRALRHHENTSELADAALKRHEIARALRNPFLLQTAIVGWEQRRDPQELLSKGDPGRTIIEAFLHVQLSRDADQAFYARLERFARRAALLTLQRGQTTFSWWELYAHPYGGYVAAAAACLYVGATQWHWWSPVGDAASLSLFVYPVYRTLVFPRGDALALLTRAVPSLNRRVLAAVAAPFVTAALTIAWFGLSQGVGHTLLGESVFHHLAVNRVAFLINLLLAGLAGYLVARAPSPLTNPVGDIATVLSRRTGFDARTLRVLGFGTLIVFILTGTPTVTIGNAIWEIWLPVAFSYALVAPWVVCAASALSLACSRQAEGARRM